MISELMRDQRRTQRVDEMSTAITRSALVPEPEPESDGGFVTELEVCGFEVTARQLDRSIDHTFPGKGRRMES